MGVGGGPSRGDERLRGEAKLRYPERLNRLRERTMQLAMIGLGRMGGNMVERLMRHGHELVAFDRTAAVREKYEKLGATPAADLATLVRALRAPRIIWIMVPDGDPVDQTIATLTP